MPFKAKTSERIPNDNLFKNDIRYQMNYDLCFDSYIDEENANKDIMDRFQNFLKFFVPIIYYSNLILSFSSIKNFLISLISIGLFILCLFLIYSKKNRDKFNFGFNYFGNTTNGFMVKVLLILLQTIYIFFRYDHSKEISFPNILILMIPNLIVDIALDIKMKINIYFSLFQCTILLCLNDSEIDNYFLGFIKNLFLKKMIDILIIKIILFFFEFQIRKGLRELWALYDSFKKSFFTIKKCLYDDLPHPIFIFQKKTNSHSIFYKNIKAEILFKKMKDLKASSNLENINSVKKVNVSKGSSVGFQRRILNKTPFSRKEENFDEIFLDKDIQNIFESEMEKCISNKNKFFDFPLRVIYDKYINVTSNKNLSFYDGDLENFDWYRIIVSTCFWKNSEAVCVQFIKNEEFYGNEFLQNYKNKINLELQKVIENMDKICDKITDTEITNEKLKEKANTSLTVSALNSVNSKSKVVGKQNSPNLFTREEKNNAKSNLNRLGLKKTSNLLTLKNPQISITPPNLPSPNNGKSLPFYDYSIWYFFKYNTNFIYDMHLTLQIYDMIMSKKLLPYNYKIRLGEFISYLEEYLEVICKLKNLKLNISNHSIEDELVVCYQYMRVILFNTILFVINNSKNNSFQNFIDINIKSEKEINGDDYKIKFIVKHYDENLNINYNDVYQILNKKNKGNVDMTQNIMKIKLLDLGIVTVYYLLNHVYENEIVMQSEDSQHLISFWIKAKYERHNNTSEKHPELRFNKQNKKFSSNYFNKILLKIYNYIPPIITMNTNFSKKTPDKKSIYSDTLNYLKNNQAEEIESDYSNEKLLPEEINISILKDKDLVNETNIILSKHFENYDKLINNTKKKTDEIISSTLRLIEKLPIYKMKMYKENSNIKFEDNCRSKIKYFYPPRFLIVEDNAFGRINLIDILKKQKLGYLIDISAYGWESVQKFKFFFNKGFIYDIIFMDINLLDMLGSEAAKIMRDYEKEYTDHHTNIVAVSVEGKKNFKCDNTFDAYFEKPIKSEEFTEYINKHFTKNRPDIKI